MAKGPLQSLHYERREVRKPLGRWVVWTAIILWSTLVGGVVVLGVFAYLKRNDATYWDM